MRVFRLRSAIPQRHGRATYDIAEALLNFRLDIDCSAGAGRTLLQAFAHQGNHRTVAWLIAHGRCQRTQFLWPSGCPLRGREKYRSKDFGTAR